jgi:hypothetical protein
MSKVIYQGEIAGSFYGFNGDQLFKLSNGTYWIQTRYKYWYHYEYRPEVVISQEGNAYLLTVRDRSIPVQRVYEVVESRIAGAFEGWSGDSTYRLENGQVWQQSKYKYQYKYAYRPEVVVYSTGSGFKMRIEELEAYVRRMR